MGEKRRTRLERTGGDVMRRVRTLPMDVMLRIVLIREIVAMTRNIRLTRNAIRVKLSWISRRLKY